jgi:hypothetical protein
MNTQIRILEETVLLLMGIVNSIDRTKVVMFTTYPNWDDTDTAEFKTQTIAQLNIAIAKLGEL